MKYIFSGMMFFCSTWILAQTITGRVLDQKTQKPEPGVLITLVPGDNSAYSNGTGAFRLLFVAPGTYTLKMDIQGKSRIIREIEVGEKDINLGDIMIEVPEVLTTNDITLIDVFDLSGIENENDNFSSVLSAGRDPFINATAFNLSAGRFRPRGYFNEDADMMMNGMHMNNLDNGRILWSAWNGMNDVLRNRTNIVNMSHSDVTFGGVGGGTFIDLRASRQRQTRKITYAHSNRTFQHRVMGTYMTGLMKNGWAVAATASHTYGSSGYIPGTGIQANSYFLSVDKILNDKHALNVVVFGSPQRRGRSTGAIQEMYDLSGSNYYNPNWGYQDGEVRSAREYLIHQPVAMIRHDWKISKKTEIMTTLGVQTGRFGSTRLDWYDASDPRPDYYRRLPSFANNPETKNYLVTYFTENEAARQIDWAALYSANANRDYTIFDVDGIPGNNVRGKLAAYVLESENFDNEKLSFNTVLNSELSEKIQITGGLNVFKEKVHYYRRLEDLLGADFYIDFNRFALRDFPQDNVAGQNDLQRPNRLVYEGDTYGHNYEIHNLRAQTWGQILYKLRRWDLMAALSLAHQTYYRNGLAQVGIFPDNSLGKSKVNEFWNYGIKGVATYKVNGRNYFILSGSQRTRPPLANESYLSPRTRDQVAPNLTNETITAFDVSYLARYTKFKARISAFYTQFNDRIENSPFYHEEFQTFVNYLLTDVDRLHTGIEFGMEYKVNSKIDVTFAGNLGDYYYTGRPKASITRDNSAEDVVQNRIIYVENYYWSGTPQVAGTLGVGYFSAKYWRWNLNINGFSKNYLSFNPDRRTAKALETLFPGEDAATISKIIDQERLPDAVTVDFSVGKSVRFRNGSFLRVNLNVGNILNNTNFRSGGFEQLRYDFESVNPDRFPPRYFYAFGLNYNLNIVYEFPR